MTLLPCTADTSHDVRHCMVSTLELAEVTCRILFRMVTKLGRPRMSRGGKYVPAAKPEAQPWVAVGDATVLVPDDPFFLSWFFFFFFFPFSFSFLISQQLMQVLCAGGSYEDRIVRSQQQQQQQQQHHKFSTGKDRSGVLLMPMQAGCGNLLGWVLGADMQL